MPRSKTKLCSAHAAIINSARVAASPEAGAGEVDMTVDIFSVLHLSPDSLISEDKDEKSVRAIVVEAWRAAVSEASELPVCIRWTQTRGGEFEGNQQGQQQNNCQRYKDALALAARAVQDREVREWWDAEMARTLQDYDNNRGGNNKSGQKGWWRLWRKQGNGVNKAAHAASSRGGQLEDDEDEERTKSGRRNMKATLESFCIGL